MEVEQKPIVNKIQTVVKNSSLIKERNQNDRENSLMLNLRKFYQNRSNLESLLNILQKKTKISLRVIDWFVTRYAHEYRIKYKIMHMGQVRIIDVHNIYQSKLAGYHKKLFDPFCRKNRIILTFPNPDHINDKTQPEMSNITTTPGQLNFFKWAIKDHIIEYVEKNYEIIKQHMKLSVKLSEITDSESDIADDETDQSRSRSKSRCSVTISGDIKRLTNSTIIATLDFF